MSASNSNETHLAIFDLATAFADEMIVLKPPLAVRHCRRAFEAALRNVEWYDDHACVSYYCTELDEERELWGWREHWTQNQIGGSFRQWACANLDWVGGTKDIIYVLDISDVGATTQNMGLPPLTVEQVERVKENFDAGFDTWEAILEQAIRDAVKPQPIDEGAGE